MWVFLTRRFRQYLVLAFGAPIVAYLLDGVGRSMEKRRGPTRVTRSLRSGGDVLRRYGRGPIARRLRDRRSEL